MKKSKNEKKAVHFDETGTCVLNKRGEISHVKIEAIGDFLDQIGFRIEDAWLPTVGLSFALGALSGIIVCVLIVLFA